MAGQKREARLRARCPGHPRLPCCLKKKDVDARHKAGHDDVGVGETAFAGDDTGYGLKTKT
jgi:hypothetical protein